MLCLPTLLALLLASASPASAAGPGWTLKVSPLEGRITLSLDQSTQSSSPSVTLSAGCPGLRPSGAVAGALTSLCNIKHYRRGAVRPPRIGTDPQLGAYTQHLISYLPRHKAEKLPAADLEIKLFHPPHEHLLQVRLRLDEPYSTNRIDLLAGFAFSIVGSHGGSSGGGSSGSSGGGSAEGLADGAGASTSTSNPPLLVLCVF